MDRNKVDVRLEERGKGNWRLHGELGYATVSALLTQGGPRVFLDTDIRIDLSGVTRADSAGLALLIEWFREAERRDKSIVFFNIPPQMQSIARICGLEWMFSRAS